MGNINKSTQSIKSKTCLINGQMLYYRYCKRTLYEGDMRMSKSGSKINYSNIIRFFVLILLTVFPLIYHDFYYDILVTKYRFYFITIIAMSVCLLILFLVNCRQRNLMSHSKPSISLADWFVIAFVVAAAISTVQSDYLYESFWGNEGRYSGLFLILLYGISYFLISHLIHFKGYLIDAFLTSGSLVCLWGITDYFKLDILNFKATMSAAQMDSFFSSIGNINTYTAFVSFVMAISMILFLFSNKTLKRTIFYYGCMSISFFALITGNSDNAYLSLAALFIFTPLICCNTIERLHRFMISIASFLTVTQIIDWLNMALKEHVIGVDSLFGIITNSRFLLPLTLGLWLLVLGGFWIKKGITQERLLHMTTLFRMTWAVILICALLLIGYILYDCNVSGNAERYAPIKNYVLFNSEWGSGRGHIWLLASTYFKDFSLFRKLFGYGPDTFAILMVNFNQVELNQTGVIYDNAHNEYIQLLVTQGLIGLGTYLALGFASLKTMLKKGKNNEYVMAMFFAVFCYGAQAFVNLNMPIITPYLWLFLALGMAACRDS